MSRSSSEYPLAGCLLHVAVAFLLWCLLFGTFLFIVPRQKRTFDEYGMHLPSATQRVIDVSAWFADYWWVMPICLIPGMMMLGALTYLIRCYSQSRALRLAWSFLLFGPPFLCLLFVWGSFLLVWLKFQDGLRK